MASRLAACRIDINGTPLPDALAGRLVDVVVDTDLLLPATCAARFQAEVTDLGAVLDAAAFVFGADVDVHFSAPGGQQLVRVFSGRLTALEPDLGVAGCWLTMRAYDHSHAMDRTRRTETYQNMGYADIARKVISRSGLSPGKIESEGGPLPFVQQTNETDWRFLCRLARDVDFEVVAEQRRVHFRRAGGPAGGRPVVLTLGEGLLGFRPRVTGVQQVDQVVVRGYDPARKQAIVATATSPTTTSTVGVRRNQVVAALGGGSLTVTDRPVSTQAQATALAKSIAATLANAFVEGDGVAVGDPKLVAGGKVEVRGAGKRFSGTYGLTSARHVLRTRGGYEVRFAISGRTPRTISDAGRPGRRARRGTIAVGVVTNNQDPDGLGRVRVSCPELGAQHEGWWARVTAPSAGRDRGLLMLPVAGDEVLLAFEHDDDQHPYVLGSVWNGTGKPQTLVHADGSFHLRSDQQLLMDAKKAIAVTGQDAVTVSAQRDLGLDTKARLVQHATADASIKSDANAVLEGTSSVTVKSATSGTVDGGQALQLQGATVEISDTGSGRVVVRGASVVIQASQSVSVVAPSIMLG